MPRSSFETVDKPKIGQFGAFGGADRGRPVVSLLRFEDFKAFKAFQVWQKSAM